MLPIVTPDEMRSIDREADTQAEVLIERAGTAVAIAVIDMLGGTYGRTVNVISGPGNNGADGRVAARLLSARGLKVRTFDVASCPARLPDADLVIDAAYGTGFRGSWAPPDIGGAKVLAVDVPSGIDALTGAADSSVLAADRTITFAALKSGLLFSPGRELAGSVRIADIGVDVGDGRLHLLERSDVVSWLPDRHALAHKWEAGVRLIAGSRGMPGAAALAALGALRSGAGMVHVSTPGVVDAAHMPIEVVQRALPASGWADEALQSFDRFQALVLGPGLGRADDTAASTRHVAVSSPLPVVIDGDALFALAWNADGAAALLKRREAATVLTPHDGEYRVLTGALPGGDRVVAARRLAADTGSVVLLKGATTVVAEPDGDAIVVVVGDDRLATAGTGDVLAGIVGALLAQHVEPFEAAAMGAWIHATAANLGHVVGFVASDLPGLVPHVLADLRSASRLG